jgi:hypothetical protein
MGNWIKPDGERTTITLPREAFPTVVDLMGKALVGGGQIAMIVYAVGEEGMLSLDVQPMREFDDPEIPPGRWWLRVYSVISLEFPFLNAPRITV